ncbi:MAG: hypothetical protein MJ237_08900 [bacterium]|nr:hypothetical protein [bacterium]
MKTHYKGLLKAGVKDLGNNFMSKSIFNAFDTNSDSELSQEEIDAGMQNLDSFIEKSVEKDCIYADIHFGKSYTESAKNTNPNSNKTISEQIIENNLKQAITQIYAYAENHKDNELIQKLSNKLKQIEKAGGIKLMDIADSGVAGRAERNQNTGEDTILIDNHDSIKNLTPEYLIQTLLHELRHTIEIDRLNSKAEEVEAETLSMDLAKEITGKFIFNGSLSEFEKSYSWLPEASPGTYNIPENTGIVTYYKPEEVKINEDNTVLIIKSSPQADLDGATIEEQIQFGTEKDEQGNVIPISATHIVRDANGDIIYSSDYGEYDKKSHSFNNLKVKAEHYKYFKKSNLLSGFGLGQI